MVKKCKCKIISFGNLNLYLLLIPLGALFNILKEKIQSKSTKFADKVIEDQHPIIITINYALGFIFYFFYYI